MYIGRPPYIQQLNDITFWYPILERIGMRTPKTKMFYVPREIGHIVDGEITSDFIELEKLVEIAIKQFGNEAFLRTGQTSNKHDWKDTCYVTDKSNVGAHLARLIEFSMMVDLQYTTFAVREMIATSPIVTAFNDMPIAREVRLFASEGKLVCSHPYWPSEAFEGSNSISEEQLIELQTMPDMAELTKMAEYVSNSFKGAWSIDFLQDSKGDWWLTDMANASASYHWPDCPNKE